MKEIFISVCNYINSLSLIDVAIISILVILSVIVISLINTLKSYSLVKKEEVKITNEIDNMVTENKVSEKKINKETSDAVIKNDIQEDFDLRKVTKELEGAENLNISLTPYEEEQEEKAIISYDELLKARNDLTLNYEESSIEDGVIVKKINMENMTSGTQENEEQTISDVRVISYEKEEEFLKSLKQLQQLLNS